MLEERRKRISDSIRQVPDFPKKGILFHDVTTLLLDPQVSVAAPFILCSFLLCYPCTA